jgi:hypothetical protein
MIFHTIRFNPQAERPQGSGRGCVRTTAQVWPRDQGGPVLLRGPRLWQRIRIRRHVRNSGHWWVPAIAILMFNGFDGSQEEMLYVCGFAALERSFNVLTFEGTSQPTVVREQSLGFRLDWEQVVTPVVNQCEAVVEIDASRLGLIGLSFDGGYLAPRAAAFEPRIRVVVAIDGIFDAHESVTNILSAKLRGLLEDRYMDAFNAATREAIEHDRVLC